jgi:hypothetical protein
MEGGEPEVELSACWKPDMSLQHVEINGGKFPMMIEGPVSLEAHHVTINPDNSTEAAVWARNARVRWTDSHMMARPPKPMRKGHSPGRRSFLISKLPKYRQKSSD